MKFLLLAALLLIAAKPAPAPLSALGLAELPPQTLPADSCAMFLWDRASKTRVVMAVAVPPAITIVRGGVTRSLAQASSAGAAVLGFAPHSVYAGGDFTVGLDLEISPSEGGGAVIRNGAVTVTAADGSAVVAPVAGLVGCT